MAEQSNDRKAGSADRNETGVAKMDHDAQKEGHEKSQRAMEEKDKDAKKQMGIEHPGRVLP